jgi:hypothetical protein
MNSHIFAKKGDVIYVSCHARGGQFVGLSDVMELGPKKLLLSPKFIGV